MNKSFAEACFNKYIRGGRMLMHTKTFVSLLCSLLLALTGCEKRATTQSTTNADQEPGQGRFDACALLTKEEIEAIQGSPIKETKSSARSDADFRISQCFYTAAEFSKSVSLAVTQSDPHSSPKRSPKDFWKETFGRYEGEVKESEDDKEKKESLRDQARARGGEEEEPSVPPKKIDGIGEAAYWTGSRFGGALYVLKKNAVIRVSVGGPDKEETKIDKSKALAQKALERL
jgi:hypothetical protein